MDNVLRVVCGHGHETLDVRMWGEKCRECEIAELRAEVERLAVLLTDAVKRAGNAAFRADAIAEGAAEMTKALARVTGERDAARAGMLYMMQSDLTEEE